MRTLFVALAAFFLAGCDPLAIKEAADRLGNSIDNSTREFMYAVATAAQESGAWRTEVDKLGNQFQFTVEMIPLQVGTQARMFVDFAIRRLKDNPAAVNNITQLIKDRKSGLSGLKSNERNGLWRHSLSSMGFSSKSASFTGVFSKGETLKICKISCNECSTFSSLRMIATRT